MRSPQARRLLLKLCLVSIGAMPSRNVRAQEVSSSNPVLPSVIHECDLNCNTLTLQNGSYILARQRWDPPNQQIIWTVEEFTHQTLILHRRYPVDQVFKGRIAPDGNTLVDITINGKPAPALKIAWGASLRTVAGSNEERDKLHVDSVQRIDSAAPREVSVSLPTVIHECDINCNTLTLENGNYTVSPRNSDSPNQRIVWTVERFTKQSIILHRTYPVDQVFNGRIAPAGDRSDEVTVNGAHAPGLKIAWGPALETVYGSNEERARANRPASSDGDIGAMLGAFTDLAKLMQDTKAIDTLMDTGPQTCAGMSDVEIGRRNEEEYCAKLDKARAAWKKKNAEQVDALMGK